MGRHFEGFILERLSSGIPGKHEFVSNAFISATEVGSDGQKNFHAILKLSWEEASGGKWPQLGFV